MIAITRLTSLKNNDGLTLKNGEIITYKSGWQVATEGMQTTSPKVAMVMIKLYKGNCGIWFSDGIYYIDKSHRVSTKKRSYGNRQSLQPNQCIKLEKYELSLLLSFFFRVSYT